MTSEYGYVYLRARPSNSVRSASVRVRRYGLVRGMSFPPRGNHDTAPYESVGSELRHCNYVRDHLVVEELGVSRDTVKRARSAAVRRGLWVVSKPAPRGAGNTKTAEYR